MEANVRGDLRQNNSRKRVKVKVYKMIVSPAMMQCLETEELTKRQLSDQD